jgi:hypothetical protein
MRKIMTFAAAMAMAALAWGGGPTTIPAKKKAPAKKPATTAAAKPTAAKPVAAKTIAVKRPTASAATSAARRGKPAPRSTTTWRNRQTAPSTDRYKEIQDALVAKGYLPSEEATGAWDQSSAGALKKFQAEQTLESTGKINSLSLIALGLGPKHDSTIPRPVDGNYPQPESGRN